MLEEFIGKKLFLRTVTFHLVGKVDKVTDGQIIHLSEASWVADSGRFHTAIEKGTLSEVEYVSTAYVNLATVTDFFPWNHELPTESK